MAPSRAEREILHYDNQLDNPAASVIYAVPSISRIVPIANASRIILEPSEISPRPTHDL
jgi:hypothetical protein